MHLLNCCNFPEKEAPQSYVHNAKCKEKCQSAAQWNQMGRLRSMKAPKFAAVVERNVLRRLHPVGPAIKSFPCGSSGGISGWRASHFKATHWYLDDGVLCGKAEVGSELPDVNFTLCLPSRRGGLGFRNPDFVHDAALLASYLGHAREEEGDESFWSEFRDAWDTSLQLLVLTRRYCN